MLLYNMPKKIIKKKTIKQKQKQKQSIVININSNNNNKRAKKETSDNVKAKPPAPQQVYQPPQYLSRGMPPTITHDAHLRYAQGNHNNPNNNNNNNNPNNNNNNIDATQILSQMAQMNQNFSGIGNLTSAIDNLNQRQSAMETRITEQFNLPNDYTNTSQHYNNQSRNFFFNIPAESNPVRRNPLFEAERAVAIDNYEQANQNYFPGASAPPFRR